MIRIQFDLDADDSPSLFLTKKALVRALNLVSCELDCRASLSDEDSKASRDVAIG